MTQYQKRLISKCQNIDNMLKSSFFNYFLLKYD